MESINENTFVSSTNTYEILNFLNNVGTTEPDALLSYSNFQDFNNNMKDTLQVFGIAIGLLVFATFFTNLGLFLYKR
jgi:hypothetical protein